MDAISGASEALGAGLALNLPKTVAWSPTRAKERILEEVEEALGNISQMNIRTGDEGITVLGARVSRQSPAGRAGISQWWDERVRTSTVPLLAELARLRHDFRDVIQSQILLLRYCAVPRANFMLRVTAPDDIEAAATRHDAAVQATLMSILSATPNEANRVEVHSTLPLRLGGLGLTRARDVAAPAYLSSLARAEAFIIENPFYRRLQAAITATDGHSRPAPMAVDEPFTQPEHHAKEPAHNSALASGSLSQTQTGVLGGLSAGLSQTPAPAGDDRVEPSNTDQQACAHSSAPGGPQTASGSTVSQGFEALHSILEQLMSPIRPYLSVDDRLARFPALDGLYLASKAGGKEMDAAQARFRLDEGTLRALSHPTSVGEMREGMNANERLKMQRILTEVIHRRRFLEAYVGASLADRARMLSQSQEGAAAFLTAIPSEPALAFSDAVARISLRSWLGIPVGADGCSPEETMARCSCSGRPKGDQAKENNRPKDNASLNEEMVGSRDAANHLLNCNRGGGPIERHDILVQEIADMIRHAGFRVEVEERATYVAMGKGGPDITVKSFPQSGCNAFVEVSITNPSQAALQADAARFPLHAGRVRETAKIEKYAEAALANNMRLHVAVAETSGALAPRLLSLIRTLAGITRARELRSVEDASGPAADGSERTGQTAGPQNENEDRARTGPRFFEFWVQRISIALRRGMLASLARMAKAQRSFATVVRHGDKWPGPTRADLVPRDGSLGSVPPQPRRRATAAGPPAVGTAIPMEASPRRPKKSRQPHPPGSAPMEVTPQAFEPAQPPAGLSSAQMDILPTHLEPPAPGPQPPRSTLAPACSMSAPGADALSPPGPRTPAGPTTARHHLHPGGRQAKEQPAPLATHSTTQPSAGASTAGLFSSC